MCDPILVTLLKMRPRYSQSSRENATPSNGTCLFAPYKEVPPGEDYTTGDDHLQESNHRSSLLKRGQDTYHDLLYGR